MLELHICPREKFSKQAEDDDGGEEDFLAVFQLCPAGRPSIASPAGPALGSA
jgi:hypothetical protein